MALPVEIPKGPFDEEDAHRTLALVVEGQKFFVPRDFLAVHSSVFKTMLYGNFTEANKNTTPLPGKKTSDFEEFLKCLIPCPKIKPIHNGNLNLILAFADEYMIDDLRDRAEVFLILQMKNLS